MKYNRNSKTYKKGHKYELFIKEYYKERGWSMTFYETKEEQYHGETEEGYEIKFDDKMATTGNVYIEYAEKSDPRNKIYMPSGIMKNDNTVEYIIGNRELFFVFAKETLIVEYENMKHDDPRHKTTLTSKGFILSIEEAKKLAAHTEIINQYDTTEEVKHKFF